MADTRIHDAEPTFAAALNRALHEASKHTNWAYANVLLPLGNQDGPVDPRGVTVEVWGAGEAQTQTSDFLSVVHVFPYVAGGPDGLGDRE